MIDRFMLERPIDLLKWYETEVKKVVSIITDAIKNNDIYTIQSYSQRIKATASSLIVASIRRRYPHLSNESFYECVHIRSRISNKACDITTPLSEIRDLQTIDIIATVDTFMSKFFKIISSVITKDEKKVARSWFK